MTLRELINVIGFQLDEPAMRKVEAQTSAMFERLKGFGEKMSMRVTAPIMGAAVYAVNAFTEYNTAMAVVKLRLDQAGDSAQFTAEQLDNMSKNVTAGTLYDADDVLKDVSGSLLMFGNISADVFTRAEDMTVDLAAAMEVDLKSAALNLGKALENPAENFEALARIAKVKFTPEEKLALETMQKTNGVAKAQGYILDILEKRHIKGTARALAEASSGFKLFMLQVNDTGIGFGKILFPYFKKFWGVLSDILKKINDLPPGTKKLLIVIAGIAAAIPAAALAIGGLGSAIVGVSTALAGIQAAVSAPALIAAFAKFGIFTLIVLTLAMAFLLIDDIIGGIMGRRSVIVEFVQELIDIVGALGQAIYDAVKSIPLLGWLLKLQEKAAEMKPGEEQRANKMTSAQEEEYATTGKIAEQPYLPMGKEAAKEYYKEGDLAAGVTTYAEQLARRTGQGLTPSPATVAGAQGGSINVTVNQTLPPGTPEEHAAIVKQSTQNLFEMHLNKELRGAMANFVEVP